MEATLLKEKIKKDKEKGYWSYFILPNLTYFGIKLKYRYIITRFPSFSFDYRVNAIN